VRYPGNKILVPYQFNAASELALELAIDVAQAMQKEVTLYHVAEIAQYPNFTNEVSKTYVRELLAFLQDKFKKIIAKWVPDDIVVNHQVAIGHAAREVVDLTKLGEYSLAIMGYQKTLLPRNQVLGSTVDRVIRFADIPILTIREPYASSDFGEIVFATDLIQTPDYIMEELSKFQHAMEARLRIVRINTREKWISTKEAETLMNEFRRKHHLSNYAFDTYDDETPEQGILNFANHIHAGTIAMGTHSLTRLDTLVHRHHIAEDVVKSARQLMWTCTL